MGWLLLVVILIGVLFLLSAGAPYVPSRLHDIEQAFTELYPLKEQDVVVDYGAGDGAVLRVVAQKGAQAVGLEINPLLMGVAWLRTWRYRKSVTLQIGSYHRRPLPENVTLVYLFSTSHHIEKAMQRVQQEANRQKRAIFVLSYGFRDKIRQPRRVAGSYALYHIKPERS